MIFLIGFRATGKTSVGERLAEKLGYAFVDTDKRICQIKAASIKEIVENEGWEGFRRCEEEVLQDLATARKSVVATGGGAVLHRNVWQELRKNGIIVWLMADSRVIAERIENDRSTSANRPSLSGKTVTEEILDILKEREPLYREIAHFAVDTGKADIAEAVDKICRRAAKITLTG